MLQNENTSNTHHCFERRYQIEMREMRYPVVYILFIPSRTHARACILGVPLGVPT